MIPQPVQEAMDEFVANPSVETYLKLLGTVMLDLEAVKPAEDYVVSSREFAEQMWKHRALITYWSVQAKALGKKP